ncbi:MAG TPA: gliding motility-associated ABC transporter substrate-binding protein GldG [Salinimicrobium sp.]|nr:gliding motility-associated ABC transporter substrate-binding protein GldG [Salinimicrobium sp.]
MFSILKKEIQSFFSSPIGYLVISLFLIVNGLFLWVFQGEFNVFDNGFADLAPFFILAPWIFIFLIPAIAMKTFSEEKKQGTLELLLTKPITLKQLILGKYFGVAALIVLAIIPTLLYVFCIYQLGKPEGNIDLGTTFGSYFGLFLLGITYAAIGVFASSITQNQIVAFIIGVFLCFFCYYAFEGVANYAVFTSDIGLEALGISEHYTSISRGVVDTRDIIYFLSLIVLFLGLTFFNLKNPAEKRIPKMIALVIVLVGLNILSYNFFERFDLTQDQRYTLSEAAKETVKDVESPVIIDVFLKGDFPPEFRRLQRETRYLLEEFEAYNPNIEFNFVNPLAEGDDANTIAEQFYSLGMTPARLNVVENGKSSETIIFPWAIANFNQKTVKIPLLKNMLGASDEERINSSVQQLEYAFADAFTKLLNPKQKKIAVMRGNGELDDRYIASFIRTLQDYYRIAPFTLDSAATNPQKTLRSLKEYDLIIEAKPTIPFSENEKYVLDQYIMNGGKSLWLVENVMMETDSLFNPTGTAFALNRDLNLNDMFFKYGIRINSALVKDLYSAPIILAQGRGEQTQFNPFPWFYSPLTASSKNHPIVNNLEAVRFEYANPIDTLKNNIKKTVLLTSSPSTKIEGTPLQISLDLVNQKPDLETFNDGEQILAVLLEGEFTSTYKNRVKPFKIENDIAEGKTTQMVVISDGDVVKNQLQQGEPLDLGFDRYTGNTYGNKEFLLNTVNYLLDDTGLVDIRTKEINIAFLDFEKVEETRTMWQIINIVFPLILLGIFALAFNFFRKRKYIK